MQSTFGLRNIVTLGLARWWLVAALWGALLVGVLWTVGVPLAVSFRESVAGIRELGGIASRSEMIPRYLAEVRAESAALDSMLAVAKEAGSFDESETLRFLYAHADSSGCSATRVTVGDARAVQGAREIPFTVSGRGDYRAVGRYVERIETMHHATRVLFMQLRSAGKGILDFSVEFVLME